MKTLRKLSFCIALLLIFASCGNSKETNSGNFSSSADSSSVIQHIEKPEYYFSFNSLDDLLKEHQNGYTQYFKEATLVESEEDITSALKTLEIFKNKTVYFPTYNGKKMALKKGDIEFENDFIHMGFTCTDSNNEIWEFGFFYRNDFSESDLEPDKYYEGTLQSGEKTLSSYLDNGDFYIIVKPLNVHIRVSTNAGPGNYIEQPYETEEGIDVKTAFFNPNFGLEKIADPLNSTQK